MSSPLIPWGTETENKWSLTPLFSQGPGSDPPLLRNRGCGADVRCLAAELSSGLSAQHNGKSPSTLLAPSSTFNPSSVALLTTQSACSHGDDLVSNWSIEVGRHRLVWLSWR